MGNIIAEKQGSIFLITVSREDKYNALNMSVIYELEEVIKKAENDNDVRCIVLTGKGEKAFVAGADIKEMSQMNSDEAKTLSSEGSRIFEQLASLSVPVIAAVNGWALGGGCELAIACDIRIASENAVFALPESSLGISPGWGGTQRLLKIVGYPMACEMAFSGVRVSAQRALQIGLVNRVVPQNELMNEAMKLAEKIASNAPIAVKKIKEIMKKGSDLSLRNALPLEAEIFYQIFKTKDSKAGLNAFLNKEKYNYQGK